MAENFSGKIPDKRSATLADLSIPVTSAQGFDNFNDRDMFPSFSSLYKPRKPYISHTISIRAKVRILILLVIVMLSKGAGFERLSVEIL